jgi:uncharacterized coiled-coil DUF342 family protein
VALDPSLLKAERESLRETLRQVEAELRRVESELKAIRQREIQTKREIEALGTLIDLAENRDAEPAPASASRKPKA